EGFELALDKFYMEKMVPFKLTPFKGRKSRSTRVVLVELFSGAHCLPCASADVAFDAARGTFKNSRDVVFLRYHLHIRQPHPLTNPDGEARFRYYDGEKTGLPAVFLDGRSLGEGLGGAREHAERRFKFLRDRIEKALEEEEGATLSLRITRKGDKLSLITDI